MELVRTTSKSHAWLLVGPQPTNHTHLNVRQICMRGLILVYHLQAEACTILATQNPVHQNEPTEPAAETLLWTA